MAKSTFEKNDWRIFISATNDMYTSQEQLERLFKSLTIWSPEKRFLLRAMAKLDECDQILRQVAELEDPE